MSIASIALPRIFRIGGGASKQLPEVLASLGLSRPLIVTDGWLANSGRVAELTDGLAAAGIAARVFADTVPDPTVAKTRILLSGDIPTPLNPPSGCVFHTRCPIAQFPVCKTDVPALMEHKPGQFAACHFAGAPLPDATDPEGLHARTPPAAN